MCGLILNVDLWVVNRCVFDLPHPPLFLSQHVPSLLLANMLFESIASAFFISNWGSLVCTGECKERISVLIWQSGKQQYATVQSWVKIPNLYFLCKASERRVSEYPLCPGKRSNTVPVLYRELTESALLGLSWPAWIPTADRVANSLLDPRVTVMEHPLGLREVQRPQKWPPQKFTLNFRNHCGV